MIMTIEQTRTVEQKYYARHCIQCWRCLLVGLTTFILPLIAFKLVSDALWVLLPLEWFDTRTLAIIDLNKTDFVGFARDINGRVNFSVMSVAIWAAAIVAVAVGLVAVY